MEYTVVRFEKINGAAFIAEDRGTGTIDQITERLVQVVCCTYAEEKDTPIERDVDEFCERHGYPSMGVAYYVLAGRLCALTAHDVIDKVRERWLIERRCN
jgi:hypothetical protein